MRSRGLASVGALVALVALSGRSEAQVAARYAEPVILTGAQLPAWSGPASTTTCQPYPSGAFIGERDAHNGIDVAPPATGVDPAEIAAYSWDGLAFVEVPVQVDQRFFYCLSNPNSDFGLYSGTDKELTYEWDVEQWRKQAGVCTTEFLPDDPLAPAKLDPVGTLDDDDEIVVMASDLGDQAPLGALPPIGTVTGHGVAVTDPLNPADPPKFIYLFLQPGGSSYTAATGYVDYARDANADEWLDRDSFVSSDPEKLGSSNTGYGPNIDGTVCVTAGAPSAPRDSASNDRFPRDGITVTTDSYEFVASGRWMIRSLKVAESGVPGVFAGRPDLIDRWKGRAFQQSPDSTISLVGFEDEQVNWEANAALLGERAGPVRAIREMWGADSGTNVTKIEAFYRDVITHRYHVRVHPIPPDGLYTSWEYNNAVVGTYYNTIKPDGVTIDGENDDTGNVDGVFGQPAYFDAPDPTFNAPTALLNWEQVSGLGNTGSLVYIIELKGATTAENPAVVPYYRDDSCLDDGTGDDPFPRPWPGEASNDSRVLNGHCNANGFGDGCSVCRLREDEPPCDIDCENGELSGVWGAHGVHYFVTNDTDNAASPEVLTEIDAQQWQFVVPNDVPTNRGQEHGNVVIAPLVKAAVPAFGVTSTTSSTSSSTSSTAPGATTTTSLFPPPPTTTTSTLPPLPPILAPSAADVSGATDEDVPVQLTLAGTDLDTCELTFSIVDPPTSGTLGAITNNACSLGLPSSDSAQITYTPNPGFSGTDSFTYQVNDGTSDSNVATVDITVKVTNPPLCATGPEIGCRQPVVAGRGILSLKNATPDLRDRLVWRWVNGAATSKADFGDPLTDDRYQLCVYDGAGNTIAGATAPAGGDCAGRPCWRERGNGYKFRSLDRSTLGGPRSSFRLALRAGPVDGHARIKVRAKGVALGLDPLPVVQPVTVQLKHSGGECWEAIYGAPARKNTSRIFRDRAD